MNNAFESKKYLLMANFIVNKSVTKVKRYMSFATTAKIIDVTHIWTEGTNLVQFEELNNQNGLLKLRD